MVVLLGFNLGKVHVYKEGEQATGFPLFNAIADFTYKRRVLEILLDVMLIALAYYGAYLLRWEGRIGDEQLAIFLKTLPVVIVIEIACLSVGGVYRGLWRYLGIDDLLVVSKSVFAGCAASAIAVFLMYQFSGPSRAVFLLNTLLLLVFVSASRLSFRLLRVLMVGREKAHPDAKPVLIYGAGDSSEMVIREILRNPDYMYAPVGFIDDDKRKAGKRLYGYRIFASDEVTDVVRAHNIKDIIVSSWKVPNAKLELLRSQGLSLRRMSVRIE
jgi:FlaA1/EpsC-like NDP-sugar epimerase